MADKKQVSLEGKTSLEKYKSAKNKSSGRYERFLQNGQTAEGKKSLVDNKLQWVKEICNAIEDEIRQNDNHDIYQSSFVAKVQSILDATNSSKGEQADAYYLICAVTDGFEEFKKKCEKQKNIPLLKLFEDKQYTNDEQITILKAKLRDLQLNFKPEPTQDELDASESTSSPSQTVQPAQPAPTSQPFQPAQPAATPQPSQPPQPAPTSQLSELPPKPFAHSYNQQILKTIEELHSEQQKNRETLQTIQRLLRKPASQTDTLRDDLKNAILDLQKIRDKIENDFILLSAKQQIDLWNVITKNLEWHETKAEQSGNQDYRTAVENYKDYCRMIENTLYSLGVEAFETAPGERFNANRHVIIESGQNSSDKRPPIRQSLRKGFRYMGTDNVIQKEQVCV